jgi:hypothetical protein
MKHLLAVLGLLLIGAVYAAEPNCWDTAAAKKATPVNCWDVTCADPACGRTGCVCNEKIGCFCDPKKSCPEQCPMAKDYEWRRTADGTQAGLYCRGTQVGAYRFDDGVYRELHGEHWGELTKPPVAVPPMLLEHFVETCRSSSSQSTAASPQLSAAPAEVGVEGESGSCQSGSSGRPRRLFGQLFRR